MNLQQLKYLVTIADCHSITKASKALFVSQPYLSKVVSDFETKINKQLFVRYNNGLELTSDGHKVYLLAQSIISQMEQLENLEHEKTPENNRGKLLFSVGNLIFKDSLLLEYISSVPATMQDIDFQETTIEGCIKNVESDASEFAILVVDDFQKALINGLCARKELTCLKLDEGDPYIHVHRNHPLVCQNDIVPGRLSLYPFVCLKMDEYAKLSIEKQRQAYPDFCVPRSITVNHYHTYLNIVKSSDAYITGNKWQISELEKMGIQSVRLPFILYKLYLMIIKKKFVPFSWEAKKFLHLFSDSYGLDRV